METEIFLGEPPPRVKQWIIDRAKTVVKYTAASGLPDWEGIVAGELTRGSIPNLSDAEIVEIGGRVTRIGSDAFYACHDLINVTIPNSVMNIGERAFAYCSGLTSVSIGNSVTSIGNNAFAHCNESLFDTTTIPGVKLVDGWAVGYTDSLSGNLNLTGARGIADNAFRWCSGLASVTIPDSVTSIGVGAFFDCWRITSVSIGNSVTSIGNNAFSGCSGLTSFVVGGGNTNYMSVNGLLLAKHDMTLVHGVNGDIVIPDGVTSIENGAFSELENLTSVAIPDSVTSIGSHAFDGCSSLTSVTIPNSVTSIGEDAFDGCSSLTSVTITANGGDAASVK